MITLCIFKAIFDYDLKEQMKENYPDRFPNKVGSQHNFHTFAMT